MQKKLSIILFGIIFFLFFVNPTLVFADTITEVRPNDEKYVNGEQWGLDKIEMHKAWSITTGSKDVRVGIVDSGIVNHRDLKENIIEGIDFYWDDNDASDDSTGHGTHIAGIIGAKGNNKFGIAGVCWDITMISLQAFIETDCGDYPASKAVEYATSLYNTADRIPILNISLNFDKEMPELERAIRNYPGLVICSSGNFRLNTDEGYIYPGHYGSSLYENPLDNMIVVGNSDQNDIKAPNSNYGKKSVDLFAPGQNIVSTSNVQEFKIDSGTSFAAPLVTGVAALLLSKYPNMTTSELKASILMNVDKVSSLSEYCTTGGRLNAYKALSNPHFHSFRYVPKTVSYHQNYCDCGMFSFPLEEHLYLGDKCALCNAPHRHSYSIQYYNQLGHIEKCICGQTKGSPSPHVITYEDAHDGDNKAICLGCNAELDLRYDGAQINPFSLVKRKETKNGSYILPNGIIVLVEKDREAYFNGTLIFYDKLPSIR
ncbi:MAG: S8 family serine peptidase [Anaeroplasmataceae bacterium]|nr:S8 family serine peptidase [Anaeroplasmataceae bacterium]